jgi:hypothetical protein
MEERIEKEIDELVTIGEKIVVMAQSSDRKMSGNDLAEVTTWVTRIGHAYSDESASLFRSKATGHSGRSRHPVPIQSASRSVATRGL